MDKIKYIFWNSQQRRLRTGYRVILLIVLSIVLGFLLRMAVKSTGVQLKFDVSTPLWGILFLAGFRLVVPLFSVWCAGRFLDRRFFADFGFHFKKEWWLDLLFGLGLGVVLMVTIFFVQLSAGWITISQKCYVMEPTYSFIFPFVVFFVLFLSVGIAEELTTRGYLLKNLAEGFNLKFIGPKGAVILAWIITSIVFGLFHFTNPNATLVSTVNIMLGGLFLGLGYVLTKELAIPIGLHITWNFFQGNVFGFPVSGTDVPAKVVTLFKIEQGGPDLWTGGVFGPEAGLVGLCAMLSGSVLTIGWIRITRGASGSRINKDVAQAPDRFLLKEDSKDT